jgi:hypothetical protein
MARNHRVTLTGEGEPAEGQTAGLSSTGALRVATAAGLREIYAGELSVAEVPDAPRG